MLKLTVNTEVDIAKKWDTEEMNKVRRNDEMERCREQRNMRKA